MINPLIIVCTTLAINAHAAQPSDPVVVADNDGNVDAVQNLSTELLDDARQRKSIGKAGYGAQYRRAAWAALDESATGDTTVSVAILQELITSPETTFDTYDAYRMLGQMHSRPDSWEQGINYYETAMLLAETEPALIDTHPSVFVSVCQGLSISNTALQRYNDALSASIALRDHPSNSLSQQSRRTAAYAAVEIAAKTNDLENYIKAWDVLESRYPERLSGRSGVVSRYLHAMTLADFGENERDLLEQLWSRQDIRDHDNCITVGLALANSWVTGDESQQSRDFAYLILNEVWSVISEKESMWSTQAQGDQSRVDSLNRNIKAVLVLLIETAIELNENDEAMGFVTEFIIRYGESDSRGASWTQLLSNRIP